MPPEGWNLTLGFSSTGGASASLTVSPDGRRLAFIARNREGRDRLWVRALDALAPQELPGTDGVSAPFWSPDSRFIGFFADGKLKKIDIGGGPPVTLCDTPTNRGGTWSRDDVILFGVSGTTPIMKVPASSGVPTPATVLGQGETGHGRPSFLPDGRHFAFRVFSVGPRGARRDGPIYIGSLDSAEKVVLFENPDASNVVFTQRHVLVLRGTTLSPSTRADWPSRARRCRWLNRFRPLSIPAPPAATRRLDFFRHRRMACWCTRLAEWWEVRNSSGSVEPANSLRSWVTLGCMARSTSRRMGNRWRSASPIRPPATCGFTTWRGTFVLGSRWIRPWTPRLSGRLMVIGWCFHRTEKVSRISM